MKGHDLVVDLVAVANPSLYLTHPLDVFHLNFTENLRIVEHCVKYSKLIVQFSTCEVYGRTVAGVLGKDPAGMAFPFNEDTSPLIMGPVKNHRWIYACAKQLLERVLHAYGLEDGLNYTIIRPSNFIGPRIDYLPSETTIRGLAELLKSIFDEEFRKPGDPDPEIVDVPAEEFYGPGYEDCDRRIPDVSKARALLGWESRHDLRSVVYHTMKYFVDRHRAG